MTWTGLSPGARPTLIRAGSQSVPAPVWSVACRVKVDLALWSTLVAVTRKVPVPPGVKVGNAMLVLLACVTSRLVRPRSAWTSTWSWVGGPGSKAWIAQPGGPGAILLTQETAYEMVREPGVDRKAPGVMGKFVEAVAPTT